MFPRPHHPSTPREIHPWRTGLRHALDLVIAFATLADGDATPDAGERAGARPAFPPETVSTPARAEPTAASGVTARRAPRRTHPHRRALHAPARNRRPGAVRAAPPPCLTPLRAGHTGRGRTPLAPSR
jgi:hypothetical protein